VMDVCQSAQLKVNSELFEAGMAKSEAEPREISRRDFLEILENRKPSISKDSLTGYENWSKNFKAL